MSNEIKEKSFTIHQWVNFVLGSFNKEVKDKKYDKLSYNKWRNLSEFEGLIYIELLGSEIYIHGEDFLSEYYFRIDDNSFGEFLFNQYFKNEPIKLNMPKLEKVNITGRAVNVLGELTDYCMKTTTSAIVTTQSLNESIDCLNKRIDVVKDDIDNLYATKLDVDNYNLDKENDKENKTMMKGFNFDFGSCENDNVRMSLYGLAVKNAAGNWVSYNQQTGDIVDVDILNFDGGKWMWKMPVAIKDIIPGAVIIHQRKPMFVKETVENNKKLLVIDVINGEEKIILPVRSPFGFDFVTQVISLFNPNNTATVDNPFGNMLPFLMMDDDASVEKAFPLMMMMNSNFNLTNNPMFMYALMSNKNDVKDMLPLFAMMNHTPIPVNVMTPPSNN